MTRPDFSTMTVEQFIAWSDAERERMIRETAGKAPLTQEQFNAKVRRTVEGR